MLQALMKSYRYFEHAQMLPADAIAVRDVAGIMKEIVPFFHASVEQSIADLSLRAPRAQHPQQHRYYLDAYSLLIRYVVQGMQAAGCAALQAAVVTRTLLLCSNLICFCSTWNAD